MPAVIDQAPAIDTSLDGAANAFEAILSGDVGENDAEGEEQTTQKGVEDSEPEAETAAEGSDEDAPTDDAGESDDESDDQYEPLYTVKVNGEEQQVPASELIKGYQLNSDYTRKTQALADERREHQAEFDAVKQERAYMAQLAQTLESRLREMAPPPVDWERLRATDPIEFAAQWAQHQMREQQVGSLRAEQERIAQIQAAEQQQSLAQLLGQESERLAEAVPDWKDPEKAKAERKALREYALSQGFEPADIDGVYDHRVVVLMRKAQLYDQLQARKPQAQKKLQEAPVLKPSATPGRKTTDVTRAKQRLAQTGRVEDAASVFEHFL